MALKHALVIDDNALNIDILTMLLESVQVKAFSLTAPIGVPEIVMEMPSVDIVFLDLVFPEHDGLEVFHKLKALPELAEVPIVAYSVHANEIDTARRLGFHSFLSKPLHVDRFNEQIYQIFSDIPVWDAG